MKALFRKLHERLRLANRRRLHRRNALKQTSYTAWVEAYDSVGLGERANFVERLTKLSATPVISVLMPTFNPRQEWFEAAVSSVRQQIYPHWQLCIADDASESPWLATRLAELERDDPRIRVVRRVSNGHISVASNTALTLATGEWVARLDHHDELREHALLLVAEAVGQTPDAGLIYSDEDQLDALGHRCAPHFKPDWDEDLCRSYNMACHLLVARAELVRTVGGFRAGYEGAQDHDLVLRLSEQLTARQIVHVPHVLYHWRIHEQGTSQSNHAKPDPTDAGRRSIEDHLQRKGYAATVETLRTGRYRVRWKLPAPVPRVSILIPTRNQAGLLRTCLESLTRITDYPSYEILIVDNGSDEADALALLAAWEERSNVRLIRAPGPFNYSALNNQAASIAQGDVLVLMNNDIEVLHPDWLTELTSQACRPDVGAVGAKLLYPDRTVQHAGVIVGTDTDSHSPDFVRHAHRGLAGEDSGYMSRAAVVQTLSAVTGACLAVRRDRYEAVGGLDETHLAVAFNDIDFCLRLEEKGLKTIWTPFATLIHHESVSRGKDKLPQNQERFQRERSYMLQRWGARLSSDPYYNANLSLQDANFNLKAVRTQPATR